MEIAMIQDNILPIEKLDPIYLDRASYFGDGVYEVMRSYNGSLFALDKHIERLKHSLGEVGIVGVDIEDIRSRIEEAFTSASIANARIYFHITRGRELRQHVPGNGLKPSFFLTVTEIADYSDEKEHGIAVASHADWRWKRCDIKSLNLMANVLAKIEATKKGCQEAVLVDDRDFITEGASSAIFMVKAKEKLLITRALGPEILPSITRQAVIQLADDTGLMVIERRYSPAEAKEADELIRATTPSDVTGIVEFDGVKIGDGRVGQYTKKLMEEFDRYIKK